ncbi:hypothetical protein A1E_03325 [Rickettsia canadensis str. McKiel]|uniref:Uncharacterized protein n=1 Tax=Rickettsia canadensis (strain McKiel) TaxID=293613 RepID=A8EZ17_RICCK|nr:hypothetical protein A1E_03325 [Rickettsia canadensis str. McKiel]
MIADSRRFASKFATNLNNIVEQKKSLAITVGKYRTLCLSSAVLEYYKIDYNTRDKKQKKVLQQLLAA